jgi:hypothetical protein
MVPASPPISSSAFNAPSALCASAMPGRYRHKLKLKAKLESSSSCFCFKRLVPSGCFQQAFPGLNLHHLTLPWHPASGFRMNVFFFRVPFT